MGMKMGQKVSVEVEYLVQNADGSFSPTEEMDSMPVWSLEDPSMGEFKMSSPFKGHFHPLKPGIAKFSVKASDGGIEFLDEGEILIAGKDAIKSALKIGLAEDVLVEPVAEPLE